MVTEPASIQLRWTLRASASTTLDLCLGSQGEEAREEALAVNACLAIHPWYALRLLL